MIKINAGDLRTPVRVLKPTVVISNSRPSWSLTDVLNFDLYCQWVNAHGRDVSDAVGIEFRPSATLRCRYNSAIAPGCIVQKNGGYWTVTAVDNISDGRHWMELKCMYRGNVTLPVFTFWTADKTVKLFGAYLSGSVGDTLGTTGRAASDAVTLVIPQTAAAYHGVTPVTLMRPKAYAALSVKTNNWAMDDSAFFAVGDIDASGKHQAINAAYDDVFRVQSVTTRNSGIGQDYIEVTGR